MRAPLVLAALLAPAMAAAQISNPPANTATLATKAEVAAVQATAEAAQAAIPVPAATVPGMEMVGGSAGSTNTYRRGDAVQPRISRTGSCTLNVLGVCTAAWVVPFPAGTVPVMFGDPVPVNTTATFPISCNVTAAPTATGVPVKCWQGQSSLVSILGATVVPFNATLLSGVTVTVSAIPPVTQ